MIKASLFSPMRIGELQLRNRVVATPMCQYSAVDGTPTAWHRDHHALLALGGVALGFVEATGVEPRGRISYGCTGLWSDTQIPAYQSIANIYHRHGAAAGIQLAHAGRKASCTRSWESDAPLTAADAARGEPPWKTVAPSAIRIDDSWPLPHELSISEIQTVVQSWSSAAARAAASDFDVIEIHAAHGYLIHEFLSPIANHRTDAYGGSLPKRMRFALEIVNAVRDRWPRQKPLFFRVSAVDGVPRGWSLNDTVELAHALKSNGVDVVDCSSGAILDWIDRELIPEGLGYQVPFAERVKRDVGISTMAVGLIIDPMQAEHIIATGKADLVALGRQLLADPFWVLHAAQELQADPDFDLWPLPYRGSLKHWYPRRIALTGRAAWSEAKPENGLSENRDHD